MLIDVALLIVVLLNGVMLSVILLKVVAPMNKQWRDKNKSRRDKNINALLLVS